jgi:outer membrane protein TolC
VYFPQIGFSAEYDRDTKLLNNVNYYFRRPLKTDNLSSGFSIQLPLFDLSRRAKARESAAEALRATVEAEQAQRQNEVHIAELTGSLRELDTLSEIAGLKQQIADEQLQTVLAQLELGNGAGSGPAAQPQIAPKAEQLTRIDERQKFQDALDAGFDLSKARLSLLRALGHMEDWLHELHTK